MREAAADLNFEEAARLRDEVKRLRATELAVVDDPPPSNGWCRTRPGLCRRQEIRRGGELAGECGEETRRCIAWQHLFFKSPQTHLDEMHGPNPCPTAPTADSPQATLDSGSKIFQPTDSRQSGPEFGPSPRSSGRRHPDIAVGGRRGNLSGGSRFARPGMTIE